MRDAFFFDSHSKEDPALFGTCTFPSDATPSATGIFFCNAFSEERQRSYRSTFLFAEQLAREGISSFRFDYKGTGDSQGNLGDATLDTMVDDAIVAYEFAKRRLGVQNLVVLGVRLGTIIALRASLKLPDVKAVVLWNPVTEGRRYYRDMMRTEAIINLARKKTRDEDNNKEPGLVEVDAELLSPKMVDQLKSIDLLTEKYSVPDVLITGCEADKIEHRQIEYLKKHLETAASFVTCWEHEVSDYWSARSMHDAFYPAKTFVATLEWLRKVAGRN